MSEESSLPQTVRALSLSIVGFSQQQQKPGIRASAPDAAWSTSRYRSFDLIIAPRVTHKGNTTVHTDPCCCASKQLGMPAQTITIVGLVMSQYRERMTCTDHVRCVTVYIRATVGPYRIRWFHPTSVRMICTYGMLRTSYNRRKRASTN